MEIPLSFHCALVRIKRAEQANGAATGGPRRWRKKKSTSRLCQYPLTASASSWDVLHRGKQVTRRSKNTIKVIHKLVYHVTTACENRQAGALASAFGPSVFR